MNLIKQEMTEERMTRIHKSVRYMTVMAELIKMEYLCDMDVRFKNPMANQFAGKLIQDANQILFHLRTNKKVNVQVLDQEYLDDYAGELFRVFHFFIGLPLAQIKEVMDNLDQVKETVEL